MATAVRRYITHSLVNAPARLRVFGIAQTTVSRRTLMVTAPRHTWVNERQGEVICARCNSPGHYARDCSRPKSCYRCGKPGHLAAECPSTEVTCYRCLGKGHLSIECTEEIKETVWRPSSGENKAGQLRTQSAGGGPGRSRIGGRDRK